MRKIVAKFKIEVSIGDCSVSTGRNIGRLIKMRRSFSRSKPREQNCVVKCGTNLTNAASVVVCRSSVDNYACNFITSVPSSFADGIIKGECPRWFNNFIRNRVCSEPNVVSTVARIVISAK